MVATTLEELHDFAQSIGVKPHFFHKHKRLSHYDITTEQHATALIAGAKLVSTREIISVSYVMNAAVPLRPVPPKDTEKYEAFKRLSDPADAHLYSAETIVEAFASAQPT